MGFFWKPGPDLFFLDKYDAYCRTWRRNERTIATYGTYAKRWREYLTRRRLRVLAVSTDDVMEYVYERAALVRPATVNNEMRWIRALYAWLQVHQHIDQNPTRPIMKLDTGPRPIRIYSQDELERLFIAGNADLYFRDIMALLLYTGFRKNELRYLEWRDVDHEQQLLWVRNKDFWSPKNRMERSVPIHTVIRPVISRLERHRDRAVPWVLQYRGLPWSKNAWYRHLQRMSRMAGVQGATLHRFRHTFGTRLAQRGINHSKLQQLMGHREYRTTLQYINLAGCKFHAEIEQLDFLSTITPQGKAQCYGAI